MAGRSYTHLLTIDANDNAEKVVEVPLGVYHGRVVVIVEAASDGTVSVDARYVHRENLTTAEAAQTNPPGASLEVAILTASAVGADVVSPAMTATPLQMPSFLLVQRNGTTAGANKEIHIGILPASVAP